MGKKYIYILTYNKPKYPTNMERRSSLLVVSDIQMKVIMSIIPHLQRYNKKGSLRTAGGIVHCYC